jgi:hypothetical protein
MQLSAIWAPPSVGAGVGGNFTIRNAYPLCHYVLFVFYFCLSIFIFYVAQPLIVYNKMKVENYGHQR